MPHATVSLPGTTARGGGGLAQGLGGGLPASGGGGSGRSATPCGEGGRG